jgi:hypothetical protein
MTMFASWSSAITESRIVSMAIQWKSLHFTTVPDGPGAST